MGFPKPFIKGHHARNNNLSNRGPDHPAWKGGRYISAYGYAYIYMPEHPSANSDGHVLEHRLVCEQALGRPLRSDEEVHHINGDKLDNRAENLVALTKSAHAKEHAERLVRNADIARAADPSLAARSGAKGAAVRWHKGQ